jgi:cephalosporin hydroxylase
MKSLLRKLKFPFSHTSYSLKGIDKGHHQITYRGVPCIKCPFDYVIYQMILNEVRPDLIIEIGTNYGGSALYLADILENIGGGEIHTIDIDDRAYELVKKSQRIKFFHNGWEGYDLQNAKGYEKILVIEDGSHEFQSTLGALKKFGNLVTSGSYMIVEDGIIDELGQSSAYGGGPVKAIKNYLATQSEFIIDDKWLNMFGESATFNTLGYLKKK